SLSSANVGINSSRTVLVWKRTFLPDVSRVGLPHTLVGSEPYDGPARRDASGTRRDAGSVSSPGGSAPPGVVDISRNAIASTNARWFIDRRPWRRNRTCRRDRSPPAC